MGLSMSRLREPHPIKSCFGYHLAAQECSPHSRYSMIAAALMVFWEWVGRLAECPGSPDAGKRSRRTVASHPFSSHRTIDSVWMVNVWCLSMEPTGRPGPNIEHTGSHSARLS